MHLHFLHTECNKLYTKIRVKNSSQLMRWQRQRRIVVDIFKLSDFIWKIVRACKQFPKTSHGKSRKFREKWSGWHKSETRSTKESFFSPEWWVGQMRWWKNWKYRAIMFPLQTLPREPGAMMKITRSCWRQRCQSGIDWLVRLPRTIPVYFHGRQSAAWPSVTACRRSCRALLWIRKLFWQNRNCTLTKPGNSWRSIGRPRRKSGWSMRLQPVRWMTWPFGLWRKRSTGTIDGERQRDFLFIGYYVQKKSKMLKWSVAYEGSLDQCGHFLMMA